MTVSLVLASASVVRLKTLQESGFSVEARPVDIDETARPDETLEACVSRLAQAKLDASTAAPDDVVVACDTLGEHEGQLLGKPATTADAVALLTRLQGRTVRFVTGCALRAPGGTASRLGGALITFAAMSAADVAAYVATGEPLRAAGGINVRGRGAAFVTRVDGDQGAVFGISPRHVWEMLDELGVPLHGRWAEP